MIKEAVATKDFQRAFDSLQPQKKKIVYEKIDFLILNPRHPSLKVHQLQRVKGDIREFYIDDGMRILFNVKENVLQLWNLGGHAIVDDAHLHKYEGYRHLSPWPLIQKSSDSDATKLPPETKHFSTFTKSAIEVNQKVGTLNLFAYYRSSHLRVLGVPEDLVNNVQDASSLEDALKVAGLPEQVHMLLEEICTSPELETVVSDSSRLLFRTTLDRLKGYFEGKIKKLMLDLQPEQQRYVEMDSMRLLLLKGTAGSGKTTIGIYRAIHLAGQGRNTLVLAYTKTLSSVTKSLIEELIGPIPENLRVNTLHNVMMKILNERRIKLNIPPKEEQSILRRYLREALNQVRMKSKASVLRQDEEFFSEEIKRVIKGLGLKSIDEYKNIKRYGRKTALAPTQREAVWEVYKLYQMKLNQAKIHDWEDVALLTLQTLHERPLANAYDDIIIDEAQDLTPIQLQVAQKLVVPTNYLSHKTNSIVILGDAAQTLYSRGFSWEQAGIQARGRTAILRKNHRNTLQIAEAAAHLLKQNTLMRASNEYIEPEWTMRQGDLPHVLRATSHNNIATNQLNQINLIRSSILNLVSQRYFRLSDIAVLCPTNEYCKQCKQELTESGLPAVLSEDKNFNILEEQIKILTIHSAKGLEFPVVFLLGLIEGELPRIDNQINLEDEERQLAIEKQRTICYVGMTRAAEALYLVTIKGKESRFVRELGENLVLHL